MKREMLTFLILNIVVLILLTIFLILYFNSNVFIKRKNKKNTIINEYYLDVFFHIKRKQPFGFLKFGDGEYFAMTNTNGSNCDGTQYTIELGNKLKESIKYFSKLKNIFAGRWQSNDYMFKAIEEMVKPNSIQWTDYHTMIFKTKDEYFNTKKRYFYKAIRDTVYQKIYICNESMVKLSKDLLKIDNFVVVDPSNWFSENYDKILENTILQIKNPENCLILTSAGMGSKVLLMDIHKRFPKISFIDIGSALDLICSDRRSRDFHNLNDSDIMDIRNDLLFTSN
jgi:hypothetical protein